MSDDNIEIEYWLEVRAIYEKESFCIPRKEWEAMTEHERSSLLGDKINVLIDEKVQGDYKIKN